MSTRTSLLCLALVLPAAVSAPAQYRNGDVIVAGYGVQGATRVFGITPQGAVYTAFNHIVTSATCVAPAPDNRTLWMSGLGHLASPAATFRLAPDGTYTTLYNLALESMDVDGGGNVIGVTSNAVLKIAPGGVTTLFGAPPGMTLLGGGLDLATGDLVGRDVSGRVYRLALPPRPPRLTTLVQFPSLVARRPYGNLTPEPETGCMIGSLWTELWRLSLAPTPSTMTLLPLPGCGDLDRDPRDGQFVVAAAFFVFPAMAHRFDATSSRITASVGLPASSNAYLAATTVAGSRHLLGANEPAPGQPYWIRVSFPNEPGAFYAVALSFGFLPGIAVDHGRRIHLNPDPLFFWSLTTGGIFRNFRGRLDARGEATAMMTIPNLPAVSRTRFFAAAVTLVNGRISMISDPLGVTIR